MSAENKLKKIHDQALIASMLTSSKEAQHEAYAWKLVGGSKYLANIKIEAVRKTRGDFAISPVSGDESRLMELVSSQTYIDIYIPDAAVLCRCEIRQTDAPSRYYLRLPDFLAQVERRKNMRLQVYKNDDVKIGFLKTLHGVRPLTQQFNKSCFDISTGGFSFLVSRMESKFFKINDPIRGIDIKIGDFQSLVGAEIALIKEIEPDEFNGLTYKVWRICCRFSIIDDITKKKLEMFILDKIKLELDAI